MKKRRSKFVLEVETGIILFATLHSHFPLLFLPFKLKEEKGQKYLAMSVSSATSVLFNPFYSVFFQVEKSLESEAVCSLLHFFYFFTLANLCGVNLK